MNPPPLHIIHNNGGKFLETDNIPVSMDERDKRAREIVAHIETWDEDRPMTEAECAEFAELIKLFEQKYLEVFMQEHPDFPGRAALWFSKLYEGSVPHFTDPMQITIPCELPAFQIIEWETAYMLSAYGCSDRLIGEFLKRDKGTISKYLEPLRAVIRAPLEKEEKDRRVKEVATEIFDSIRKRADRASIL